jgi:hypothetical protein
MGDMLNKLVSLLLIGIGAYAIIYHRKLGVRIAEHQRNKMLPFKKATAKECSITQLVGGIIFFLLGILSLFGIIHIKGPF